MIEPIIYTNGKDTTMSSEEPFHHLPDDKPFEKIDKFFLLQAINLDIDLRRGMFRDLIALVLSFADGNTGKRAFMSNQRLSDLLKCNNKRYVRAMLATPKVRRWIRRGNNEFEFNWALAREANKLLGNEKTRLALAARKRSKPNEEPASIMVVEVDEEDLALFQKLSK
jgi:hypothetical protein